MYNQVRISNKIIPYAIISTNISSLWQASFRASAHDSEQINRPDSEYIKSLQIDKCKRGIYRVLSFLK